MAAVAAPPRASIEDDWQDLDSNLSVRSLSASEDEDENGGDLSVIDLGRDSSKNASEPNHSLPNRDQTADLPRPQSPAAAAATESNHHFDLPLRPASGKSSPPSTLCEIVTPGYTDDGVSPIDEKEKEILERCYSPSNASEGTIRDPSNNPVNHHQSLTHLIETIEQFHKELQTKLQTPSPSDDTNIVALYGVLCSLRDQFDDLEPILASYAKHWSKQGQSLIAEEIPLHTGLLEWIENTEPIVLDLQRTVADDIGMRMPDHEMKASMDVALQSDLDSLTGFDQSLREFLPLMKIDHSKFQTKHMNFPDCEPTQENHSSCHPSPRPEITRIRRELYSLKDEIHRVSLVFDGIFNHIRSPDRPEDANKTMESLQILGKVITTSLTNNGSEWLDSTIDDTSVAGPSRQHMSYPSFASLSPEVLQDVTAHLNRFRVEIDVASEPWMHAGFSRRMVRNHQLVLLTECGQLSLLKATLEFLEGMLLGES